MEDKQLADGSFRFVDIRSASDGRVELDYRLMSPGLFAGKVEFRFTQKSTAGPKPKPMSDVTIEPERIHDDPFVWREIRPFPGGASIVTVLITIDGQPKLEDDIDLTTPFTDPGGVQRNPPRLILDINDTPRSSPAPGNVSDAEKVIAMLSRIAQSLARGLDDTACLGPTHGRGLTLDEMKLPQAARDEEAWARRASEMMLLAPYFGTGLVYGTSDSAVYDAMAQRLSAGNEAFYPLTIECQQLCSVLLMSRGVPRSLLGLGVNAGDSQSLPVFSAANQGGAHFEATIKQATNALTASPSPIGPGSLYQFNKPGGANKDSAHIGTILRVQNGPWKALQPFDTGGLNSPGRKEGVTLVDVTSGLGGGVFDDPWVKTIVGSKDPFSGALVIGTQHKPPANLSQWWPCGFTRLIIRRRNDKSVVYVTPLLRMHDANRDFPYSVLANSLRGVPVVDEFEPTWEVSAPRRAVASTVMTQPRNATAKALLATANVPPNRPLSNNALHLFLLVEISANPDGSALKVDIDKDPKTKATRPDTLPWGIRSGALASAIPLARVPPYLRGDET